jgi:ABC-type multidrug transport system fused ATPase/permease subunit
MDEIVVLEAGRIAERGTFSALLSKKGLFAGMAAQQGIISA